jgi:hypothetical protein
MMQTEVSNSSPLRKAFTFSGPDGREGRPEHERPGREGAEIFGESDASHIGFEPGTPGRKTTSDPSKSGFTRGVRVLAQRQYMGEPWRRRHSRTRCLGLLPNASRPLTLSVAAFAGAEKTATVIVNVDVGALANARETAMPLEFAVSAVNQKGGRQVAFARETASVTFKPGTPDRRAEANVQTHIELTPGDYEIRVAVSDPATNIVASVYGPVAVPLFGSAPLSLSDVIVETTTRMAAPPESVVPVSRATTRRVFELDESVRALMQIYQGTQRTGAVVPVSVRTSIFDANGRAIRDQLLALPAKNFTNRRAALALDLGQLPRGEYVLSVDASLERQKASRILRFAVQ